MLGCAVMDADPRLSPHNLQRRSVAEFREFDPHLRRLSEQPFVHEPALIAALPRHVPGIYTLVGGRQVGKTTLVKQFMAALLDAGAQPERIAYMTCELFADAEELHGVLTAQLDAMPADGLVWVLVDEVTYVSGWDRVVKFLADAGGLENCFLLLTGSDHLLIQDSLKRLPGRRGRAEQVDFHLRPLTFREFCGLRGEIPAAALDSLADARFDAPLPDLEPGLLADLEAELRAYHRTGGYLTAINDVAMHGEVATATMRIYADWVRGDTLRLGRGERFLREVLSAVADRYGTQVTWNALVRSLSIDHPKTVADYIAILERMDALLVVPAVSEHLRGPAPKKARKVYFADPFVHRSIRHWLAMTDVVPGEDEHLQRDLEAVFACHAARAGDVFYVKGKGEVDVAFYEGDALRLIEVKWSRQLRPEELKEIRSRGEGVIAARTRGAGTMDGVPVLPATVVLLRLA